MRFKVLVLITASIPVISCGTYRTGSGQYHGAGPYKNPSDYSAGVDSADYTSEEEQGPRERLELQTPYAPQAPFKLSWPVEPVRVNRGFHPVDDPRHEGLDLGGSRGTPIWAAHEGIVIYAGHRFAGYGNMILVEYNGEWATLYGHLDSIRAREGQSVMAGDALGTMGATGHATGVHLHFELIHNRTPTDPLPLLTRPVKFATAKRRTRRRPSQPH